MERSEVDEDSRLLPCFNGSNDHSDVERDMIPFDKTKEGMTKTCAVRVNAALIKLLDDRTTR